MRKKIKRVGRPKRFTDEDELEDAHFLLPKSMNLMIGKEAKRLKMSKNEYVRNVINHCWYKLRMKDEVPITVETLSLLAESIYQCEVTKVIKHHVSRDVKECVRVYSEVKSPDMKQTMLRQIYRLVMDHPDFDKLIKIKEISNVIDKLDDAFSDEWIDSHLP